MKSWSFFTIIAICYSSSVIADNASKVKLLTATILSFNEDYVEGFTQEVVKVNETYNTLKYAYTVLKDVPLDTEFKAEVFRSDSRCGDYEKIREYTISLCTHDNDKHAALLPDPLILLKKSGRCVVKGHYSSNSSDVFKFYNELSDEELKNSYFKLIITFTAKEIGIYLEEEHILVSNNNT